MNTASLPVPPSKAAARAAIALSGALLLGFILVWLAADGRGIGRSDFTAFYVGGTLLREGHTGDLYDESAQMPLHARLIAPDASQAVKVANENPDRKATVDQQTVGRSRRIRKAQSRKSQSAGQSDAISDADVSAETL